MTSAATGIDDVHSIKFSTGQDPTSGGVYNWSGIHRLANASQVVYPTTVEEVREVVLRALNTGTSNISSSLSDYEKPEKKLFGQLSALRLINGDAYTGPGFSKLRIIGSGLSYEPIVKLDSAPSADVLANDSSLLVCLQKLTGLVSITQTKATFAAGTLLNEVFDVLVERGKMMPCSPGVIGIQTIAGAIATGTHGQGLYQSSISDVATSLQIVLPDASIVDISSEDVRFGAFLGGLGCLGIVVAVTVELENLRTLTCQKSSVSFDAFKSHYVEWNRASEYVKAWWFPETQLVHLWRADTATEEEHEAYLDNKSALLAISTQDTTMNDTIDHVSDKMAYDTNDTSRVGRQFETVQRFYNSTSVTGNIIQIYCKGIPVPQINCEIAVPLKNFSAAIDVLTAWLAEHGHHKLHYPFIFRSTGASKAWLSPSYGQEMCYIGFLVYLKADGTAATGSFDMMKSLQEALVPLGGSPHLGKHLVKELYDFETLLPRWRDFDLLRRQLDPCGIFENDFLKDLFTARPRPSLALPKPLESEPQAKL